MGNIEVLKQNKKARQKFTQSEQKCQCSNFDQQSIIQEEDVHIQQLQRSPIIKHRNKYLKGVKDQTVQAGQSSRLKKIIRQIQQEKIQQQLLDKTTKSNLNPVKRTKKTDLFPTKNTQNNQSKSKISTQSSSRRVSGRDKSYSRFSNRVSDQNSITIPRNAYYRRQNLQIETRLSDREYDRSNLFQKRNQDVELLYENNVRTLSKGNQQRMIPNRNSVQMNISKGRKVTGDQSALANSQIYKKIKNLNQILGQVKKQLNNHLRKHQQSSNLQNNINYGNMGQITSDCYSVKTKTICEQLSQTSTPIDKITNKVSFSFNFQHQSSQDIENQKSIFVKELSNYPFIDKIQVSRHQAGKASNLITISYDSSRFQSLKVLSDDVSQDNQVNYFPENQGPKIKDHSHHHRRKSSINSINNLFSQLQVIQNQQVKHQKKIQQYLENHTANILEDTDFTSISFSKQSLQKFH